MSLILQNQKKTVREELPNIVLITMDSCRWDSYLNAEMKFLNGHCPARKAYSQATFTYASHLAMFQGILPSTRELLPFYNRYARQLIRIANRPTALDSLICFPAGTEDIIIGFRNNGYFTIGFGAMEWFKHKNLVKSFDEFSYTGIHGQKQTQLLIEKVPSDRPFFSLINFGETHDPYKVGDNSKVPHMLVSRARQLNLDKKKFDKDGWENQSKCCESIDDWLYEIFEHLKDFERSTIFIVCGDHGECFGEDELFGHGFYHPKVMEVPLAIFDFNGELNS